MRKGQRSRHAIRKAPSRRSSTLGRGGRVALSVLACALAISGAGAIGYSMLTHRTTVSGGTQYADVFKKGQAYDSVDTQKFIANPTVTDEDREVIASLSGLMQQIYARETGDAATAKTWAEQILPQLASWSDLQLPWSNSDVDPKTYVRLAELSRMELKSKAQSLGLESNLQWQVIDFAYPAYGGDTGAVSGNAGQTQTSTRAAAIPGNTGEPTVMEVMTACDQKIRKDGVLNDGDEVHFRMDTYCIDISDENPTQEVHNIGELKSFGFELVSGPTFDARAAQGSQVSGTVDNQSGSAFQAVPSGTQGIGQSQPQTPAQPASGNSNVQVAQGDQGQTTAGNGTQGQSQPTNGTNASADAPSAQPVTQPTGTSGETQSNASAPNTASAYVTTRLRALSPFGPVVRDVRYYRWAQNANFEIKDFPAYDTLYKILGSIVKVPQTSDNAEPLQIPFYLGYYGEPGTDSPTTFNAIVIDGLKYEETVPVDANVLLGIANQLPAIADENLNKIAYVIVRSVNTSDDYQVPLHVVPLNGNLPNIPIDASGRSSINVNCWEASWMSFVDGFQYAGNLGSNGTYADDVLLVVTKNENGFQIVFDKAADAAAKQAAEEEAAAKKKADEEAAAKKKADEEAAAKKKADEEAAKKKAEEAAAKLAALKSALRQGPVPVVSSVLVTTDALIDTPGYDPTKDGVPTSGITYQCSLDGAGNPTGCSIVQNRGRAGGPSSDALTVDGDGFFTQVSSAASGSASWKLEKDDAGRLTKMSGTIGGVAVSYTYEYDGAGTRLAKMTHVSGSDKDVTVFNADGSRATVTRHVGQKDEFVEKYTHIKNSQNQITQTNIQTSKGVDTWEYWYNTDGTVRMIIAAENQFSPRGYMYSYKSISSPSVAAGLASRVMVTPDATIPYGSPFLKLN